jgi:hypothetical protein
MKATKRPPRTCKMQLNGTLIHVEILWELLHIYRLTLHDADTQTRMTWDELYDHHWTVKKHNNQRTSYPEASLRPVELWLPGQPGCMITSHWIPSETDKQHGIWTQIHMKVRLNGTLIHVEMLRKPYYIWCMRLKLIHIGQLHEWLLTTMQSLSQAGCQCRARCSAPAMACVPCSLQLFDN